MALSLRSLNRVSRATKGIVISDVEHHRNRKLQIFNKDELHRQFEINKRTTSWAVLRCYMRHNPEYLSPDDCTKVLASWAAAANSQIGLDKVRRIVNFMHSKRFDLDIRDYHSCIMVAIRENNHQLVISLFNQMFERDFIKPDVTSYNFLMRSYLNNNDLDSLIETFNNCSNFNSDFVGAAHPVSRYMNMDAWAYLIEGYGLSGKIEESLKALRTLKENIKGSPVKLSPVVIQATIKSLGMNKMTDESIKFFEKYCQRPNLFSYNEILRSTINANNVEKTMYYWNRLLDHCIAINVNSNDGLHHLKNKNYSHFKSIFKWKPKQYALLCKPLSESFESMIKFATVNKDEEFMHMLFRYEYYNEVVGIDQFEQYIWANIEFGQYQYSSRLFDLFLNKGYKCSSALSHEIRIINAKLRDGILQSDSNNNL
jgi:hypothetical protein